MDVSIIIPVFNKAELTRVCLRALERCAPRDLRVEIIIVDNASTDDTAAVLTEFPAIRIIKNDTNLGFAAANNQGAQAASGTFLVLLNNDTEPQPGWLKAMISAASDETVGVVGARLLFANRTLQHAGVVVQAERFGPYGFTPYHYLWSNPGNDRPAMRRKDYQIVTGACLLTRRDLYAELGGLDETYWNGYEDVDYCFKVTRAGRRVVYEPAAELFHYESQSGPMRFSRVAFNSTLLAQRWMEFPRLDHNHHYLQAGSVRRWLRQPNKLACTSVRAPKTTILIHGDTVPDAENWRAAFASNAAPIEKILWAADAESPGFGSIPTTVATGTATHVARAEMDVRGDRYLAFLDTATVLRDGWLDELVEQIEWGTEVIAATTAPQLPFARDAAVLTADARCTLLALRQLPMHETLADFSTLHGSVADYLLRFIDYEFATRAVSAPVADVAELPPDPLFADAHCAPVSALVREDPAFVEERLRSRDDAAPGAPTASIVMLSWNALVYTQMAVESIRSYTRMPHEIIIVDNGSTLETTDWLRSQSDLTVIYNATNRGFAKGCNQGIAAASGDYIVLLNNDVVVTEGWLENLVDAVRRDPATGISAARSNELAGDQKLLDANYKELDAMHAYAAGRARAFRRAGYFTDRAIGFCLCIDRKVLEQVGGIDEQYGTGNFEDDDFCMRVRAAGYRIYVCDDVFIHHFGSVSFRTNKVDYEASMLRNWTRFAATWGYASKFPENGYEPARAIRQGFDRSKHFVPLQWPAKTEAAEMRPAGTQPVLTQAVARRMVLLALVAGESDWATVGSVVRRYLSVFNAGDSVAFAIACAGDISANVIGARVEKMIERLEIDEKSCADVLVSDEEDVTAWIQTHPADRLFEVAGHGGVRLGGIAELAARSRNDLKRLYAGEQTVTG
ncbi:MAG: glycosyltransferase family 2 protein [Candidatus Eremiobacteraeota bacterium]|nr:glycosyltransferase family 2 protein [Candidatus Eremiobacteraeota bacterium]